MKFALKSLKSNCFVGPAFGDPHFLTSDGVKYTFNGLGEYLFTRIGSDSQIQVRTERVISSNGGMKQTYSNLQINLTHTRAHIRTCTHASTHASIHVIMHTHNIQFMYTLYKVFGQWILLCQLLRECLAYNYHILSKDFQKQLFSFD